MQKRVYFYRVTDHAILALPVMPLKLYASTFNAGYIRCTRKVYLRWLTIGRLTAKKAA